MDDAGGGGACSGRLVVVLLDLLESLGGTATRAQLAPAGRPALEAAVAAGTVVRLARGVYGLPSSPLPLQAAAALRGVVSHGSAAQLWFLEAVHAPDRPHVTVPRTARRQSEAHLHWADLAASDVRGMVTTPLRTLVDCARTLPFPEALALADSALRRRLVTPAQLLARAEACAGAGRRRVLRVAGAADGRAANPFESALRGIVLEAGLEGFAPQVPLQLPGALVRVDLADRRRRVVLEADSFAWHGSRDALARDCRRYDELVAGGWLVLRFAWEHVVFRQEWVSRTAVAACREADARRTDLRRSASRASGRARGDLCRCGRTGA